MPDLNFFNLPKILINDDRCIEPLQEKQPSICVVGEMSESCAQPDTTKFIARRVRMAMQEERL